MGPHQERASQYTINILLLLASVLGPINQTIGSTECEERFMTVSWVVIVFPVHDAPFMHVRTGTSTRTVL